MGEAEVTRVEAPKLWEFKSTGGANSVWTYNYEEVDGGTKVTLEVEYEMPQGVLGKLSGNAVEKINQKNTNDILQQLKTILEE